MSTLATTDLHASALRRGRRLEYLTILWNSLEALIGIAAGLVAGSIALVGFGVDSLIEISSGAVLLWRLRSDASDERAEHRERVALKLVGLSFFALAIYVAAEAVKALWLREAPARSPVGIGLAVASLMAMPLLARAKRHVARSLSSGALHADSRQTDLCAYLSAILLVGLVLNAALGWWWADPVAGLAMLPIILKEGVDAVQGRGCCD